MRFLIVLLSLLFCKFYSQDITAYNAIYNKTFLETAQKDYFKALQIADSLYTISQTPVLQVKSLMLSATLYGQSAEFEKSIDYALRSEKIIEDTDNIIWKAKIYGFLATHYRYVRLWDQSKKYYELGISTAQTIPKPEISNSIMAMMMQESAYYWIEQQNYHKSLAAIKKGQSYDKESNLNPVFLTQNEQLLGYNYYHLNRFEKSFDHYQKALDLSKELPQDFFLVGLIHNGFALLYLQKSNLKKAKEHLDIAQKISDGSKYLSLKNEVYEISEKYYAATKNLEDYVKIKEKHDTNAKRIDAKMRSFINQSYSKIQKENTIVKKQDNDKRIIIFLAGLLIAICILAFIRYRKKNKKNIENFRQILNELDKKHKTLLYEISTTENLAIPDTVTSSTGNAGETLIVSEVIKKNILAKLNEFERSQAFTRNNISLSYLATFCETNTKYLSAVINSTKNKDYNNYINDLRIDFIVEKLRHNPKYRKYKIATLAEEAGFSSHNKFSMIFKKVTTLSPSVFIKYLEEEAAM